MTQTTETGVEELAHELWSVLGPLLRRVLATKSMPFSQLSVLGRLDRDGPATTSELAAHERVRPQSMAATVAELQDRGLVDRAPDSRDGRKILIGLTTAGSETLRRERASSQEWLRLALTEHLDPAEQAELAESIRLIRRLAQR
jgi:DNA-binding MarR family transcriptional regulator